MKSDNTFSGLLKMCIGNSIGTKTFINKKNCMVRFYQFPGDPEPTWPDASAKDGWICLETQPNGGEKRIDF